MANNELVNLAGDPLGVNREAKFQTKALLHNRKAMVIDDMGAAVVIARNMLISLGAKVVDTAHDYQSAFPQIARKHYDLILCDFNLGSGLNGQQLLRDLRHVERLSYTTLFVVVSAERTKDIVLGTIECEPDGYIAKPFTQGDFKKRITRLVEQQSVFKSFNQALDAKNYRKAFGIADSIMSNEPRYANLALKRKAGVLYEIKAFEEAKNLFDEALRKHSGQTWAKIGRARCIAEMGDMDQAIEEFEQIIVDNKLAVPAIDSLANCYLRLGNKRVAQETVAKSLELSPMSIERQRWQGELSMEVGELESSMKAYDSVIKLASGTLKENPKQYESYIKAVRKAIESSVDDKLGKELIAKGKKVIKDALKKFEDAESLRLNQTLLRALEKCKQGEAEESIAIIDAAIERHKDMLRDDPEAVIDLAETKFFAGDRPGAESMLKDLMTRYPDNKKLVDRIQAIIDTPLPYHKRVLITELNRRGKQFYEQENYEEALKHFDHALHEYPLHPAINLNAIQVLLKMIETGNLSKDGYGKAREYLDASVPLETEHPEFNRKEAFTKFLNKKLSSK
jgi:tetratricopeptide (TPR) repeat protein